MARTMVGNLPADLRRMLATVASADVAAEQRWILSLLQRHGAAVVYALWRMLGSEQEVLDAYQNVVCQLVARGPDGIGDNPASYFYRSGINAAIELIRRRGRERDRLPTVADRYGRSDAGEDPGANAEHLYMAERVRSAVLALPPHLRDVVVLRDLTGLDYRQVARIMRITPGTARVYRRQAVVRLAARMAREDCS
ncbi:MAG: sigma-70 family RNA polymerase sigma factor [Phycisphaerae bacterium]|nr:sigma-70 family RNA polymerase sigma factor [Phycisphaerae bacterium]